MKTMKKMILIALAIFAMLIPVKAQHVYFEEGFTNRWNSVNLSQAESRVGNILYWDISPFGNSQNDLAALFGYFPGGGLTNVPDRTNPYVRLASSWQKLNGNAYNWVVFDWFYDASLEATSTTVVGIQARIHPDSAWQMISETRGNEWEYYDGRISGELPEEFIAGQDSVQVAIYFKYATSENLQFLFYVDNFSFVSFNDLAGRPKASLSLIYPEVMAATSVIDMSLQNEGGVVIDKVKLGYTINNGSVQYQETTLNPSAQVFGGTSFRFNLEFINGLGSNDLRVWLTALNDTVLYAGEGDTVDFSIYMPDTADAIYPTKFLVEHFTASTCPPCKDMNEAMNPVYKELETAGKLIYVKYQMNFPGTGDPYYVAADAGVRAGFYKINAVPTILGNAVGISGYGYYSQYVTALRSRVNAFAETKSYFDISLDSAQISSNSNIYIKYRITPKVTAKLKVHTDIFEKLTTKNKRTNGESQFPHVTMKMFPNGNGNIVNFKKDSTYEFVYEHDMSKTFVEEMNDLELVVFIQSISSKEIYHAVQRTVIYDSTSVAANEARANILPIKVSPNPASEYVNIESPENACIFLYNNIGMPVYEGTIKAGVVKNLSIAKYATGIYVLKVVSDKGVATEKIIKN